MNDKMLRLNDRKQDASDSSSSLNQNKELRELNDRLDQYINTVKDLTTSSRSTSSFNYFSSSHANINLLNSIKMLEKDLETFKQLYDEELGKMRAEMEEMYILNSRMLTDNAHLESKLNDFIIKFEDLKKSNKDLLDELNDVKQKKNRLEFELEENKLLLDKPTRENKQLKKDLDDLIQKLNEKQIISENEMGYRSELEAKLRDLTEMYLFEKKIYEQELDNLKAQLLVAQTTINEIESKFNSNAEIEKENCYLKSVVRNLEQKIVNAENLNAEIKSLKTKLNAEENRLAELASPKTNSSLSFNAQIKNENDHRIDSRLKINDIYCNGVKQSSNKDNTMSMSRSISNNSFSKQVKNEDTSAPVNHTSEFLNNPKNFLISNMQSDLVQSPLLSPISNNNSNNFLNSTSSTPTKFNQASPINNPHSTFLAQQPRDHTTDLFQSFERATLLAKRDCNTSLSSIDNKTLTEASYIGNVKIHEVNRHGYFVRLLNVSSSIDEDLSNYTIQQIVATLPVAVFRIPANTKLRPAHTITVWARTDEVVQQPPHTFIWQEQEKWGTGPECTTILAKPNGQAVSWTTGCHKYIGNIDYDEYIALYPQKRGQSALKLNREKLTPTTIFSPTKHPHGSLGSKLISTNNATTATTTLSNGALAINSSKESKKSELFSKQAKRPVNSENISRLSNYLKRESDGNNSSDVLDREDDFVYQENMSYVFSNNSKKYTNKHEDQQKATTKTATKMHKRPHTALVMQKIK